MQFDAETALVIRAARETGTLEAYLREAGTPAAAAEAAGVSERGARLVGRVLADAGLLTQVNGTYEPTNRALGLLATRDARSLGTLPATLDRLDALARLPETMTTGVPPRDPADGRVHVAGAREATEERVVRACVTTAIRAARDAENVLDLCGGAGTYAREFVARGCRAAAHDAPDVCERFGPLLESRDVTPITGSLADLDRAFDLVFWADGPTRVDEPEAVATLSAAADLLTPTGTLVVIDAFDAPAADLHALATGHGGRYTPETVRDWCVTAGLDATDEPVPGTDRRAVVAHA